MRISKLCLDNLDIDYENLKENYKSNKSNEIDYLIKESDKFVEDIKEYTYTIDNIYKFDKDEFFKFYNKFYLTNKEELLKQEVNQLFIDPELVYLKTNDSRGKYIDLDLNDSSDYGFFPPLEYEVIKDKETNLDLNKVYTLKEIQELVDNDLVIFTSNKRTYKPNDSIFTTDSNLKVDTYLNSNCAFEILKDELIRKTLIQDYQLLIKECKESITFLNNKLATNLAKINKSITYKNKFIDKLITAKSKMIEGSKEFNLDLEKVKPIITHKNSKIEDATILNATTDRYDDALNIFKITNMESTPFNTYLANYYLKMNEDEELDELLANVEDYQNQLREFKFFKDNRNKLTDPEFIKEYIKFYHWNSDSLKKIYAISKFKHPKIVNVKTTLLDPRFNSDASITYKVLCEDDIDIDQDKFYTYKELASLLNTSMYIVGYRRNSLKDSEGFIKDEGAINYLNRYMCSTRLNFLDTKEYRKNNIEEFLLNERINFKGLIKLIRNTLTDQRINSDYKKFVNSYFTSINTGIECIKSSIENLENTKKLDMSKQEEIVRLKKEYRNNF